MQLKIDYTDETRVSLIAEHLALGYILIEDQRHFDGNHLIFEDGAEPKPKRDPLVEIAKLEKRIKDLEKKLWVGV